MPAIKHATKESLQRCTINNNDCKIVCKPGYEFFGPHPKCVAETEKWDVSNSRCKIIISSSLFVDVLRSINLISFIVTIIVPEFINRVLNRDAVNYESEYSEMNYVYHDTEFIDPAIIIVNDL